MKHVTIQGMAGCFHDAAAREYFSNEDIVTEECDTFPAMFSRLAADTSLLGIMAIENTIAGSLLPNHELLRRSNLEILGEQHMHISHVLCALPGTRIEDITEVNSHPMALMQCEDFLLARPHMKMVEKNDTAGSAEEIARKKLKGHAAVCGALAAKLYGLEILASDIQTNKHNTTRFLLLGHPARYKELHAASPDKASIVFTLPHTQGSLSKVLAILSFYDLNLSKIQSMPIVGHEWEYRFYIDLTFSDFDRYRQALEAVRPLTSEFRVMGEYRRFTTSKPE